MPREHLATNGDATVDVDVSRPVLDDFNTRAPTATSAPMPADGAARETGESNEPMKRASSALAPTGGTLSFRGDSRYLRRELWKSAIATIATFGGYFPWSFARANQVVYKSVRFETDAGSFQFRFVGTGAAFAPVLFGALVFSVLTLGFGVPWALVYVQRRVLKETLILRDEARVGRCTFTGSGRELAAVLWPGAALTIVTLGLYGSWMHVRLSQYMAKHTGLVMGGRSYEGSFTGDAPSYLRIVAPGMLLTALSLGGYAFHLIARILVWQLGHTHYRATTSAHA